MNKPCIGRWVYNKNCEICIAIIETKMTLEFVRLTGITEKIFAASFGVERQQTIVNRRVDVVALLDLVLQVLDCLSA